MARMSVDDSVARDPRITKLSKLAGWSRRETVGCLVSDVWPITYDQKTPTVSADLVDMAAGQDGFAQLMVDAELARWVRGNRKVRISGAEERLKYLADKSTAGRVGGLKSAEVRNKTSSSAGSTPQAERNPPVPDPVLVPSPVPDPVLVQKKIGASAAPSAVVQGAVDAFDGYYRRTHGDAKATWDGKRVAMVKTLVSKHGAPEILRRIHVLETSPPSFPPAPWDLGSFVQHFDKIARPSTPAPPARTGRIEPGHPTDYPDGEVTL